jgi:RNA polymerase sigma factor (sigma-70 family)
MSLFTGLRLGEAWAEEDLYRRFWPQVCQLLEREMDRRLRRREDPEDIAQTVFRTFFGRVRQGEFQFVHAGALWSLLQQIARRKMWKHAEHHRAQKRDVRREQEPPPREPSDEEADFVWDLVATALSKEDRPEPRMLLLQACGYTLPEICARIQNELEAPDPEIFDLWLEGYTRAEIADKFNLMESAVRHRVDRICKRLRAWLEDPA